MKIRVEQGNIHAKLMHNYPEVPDWLYLFIVFSSLMTKLAFAYW